MKRTDDYVLFRVKDGSAIVNAKFIRSKEHEDKIFLSLPPMYDIQIRVKEYNDGKWQTTKEYSVKAWELQPVMREYTQIVLDGKDELPF